MLPAFGFAPESINENNDRASLTQLRGLAQKLDKFFACE
jgi:hypothetical protein